MTWGTHGEQRAWAVTGLGVNGFRRLWGARHPGRTPALTCRLSFVPAACKPLRIGVTGDGSGAVGERTERLTERRWGSVILVTRAC